MGSLDVVVPDGDAKKVTSDEVKQVLDLVVLIGSALKGFIPGEKDDRLIDAVAFAAGKPDVLEFIGKLIGVFGTIDPANIQKLVGKLNA